MIGPESLYRYGSYCLLLMEVVVLLLLQEVVQGLGRGPKARCWLYGPHSRSAGRLGLAPKHLLLITSPKVLLLSCSAPAPPPQVLRFKPKPLEVVPTDSSPWIIHVGEQFDFKPRVKFLRRREVEQVQVEEQGPATLIEEAVEMEVAIQEQSVQPTRKPQEVVSGVEEQEGVVPRKEEMLPPPLLAAPSLHPLVVPAQDLRPQYYRLVDLKDTAAR